MGGGAGEDRASPDARRYRRLLGLFFPGRVVSRDGTEMEKAFLRLLGMERERRGRWGAFAVWMGAVGDGIWNGWLGRPRTWGEGMGNVWADLRYSGRSLRRQPSFTAVVVLSLALGIGGSTAIFSVFNTVLLRDLPYPDPGQIYMMRTVAPDGTATGGITPPETRYFTDNPDDPVVQALAYGWSQETQIVGGDGVTYDTRRYGVTQQFFDVFGTRMELGQGFGDGALTPTEVGGVMMIAPPIVISYQVWRDLFASDRDIIGKTIEVEGSPRQVVGVTLESFEFPENPGYWSMMSLGPGYDRTRYRAYVRLRPGRTADQFQAELDRLPVELGPDPATGRPMTYVAQPFLEYVVGDLRATVTILLGATAILLLIACINVTNLMLSRATAHSREAALREALGAGRWRTLRRLTTESLVLAFAGGALGVMLGAFGVRLLLSAGPTLPRLDAVPMDRTVLTFALGVTVVTGVLIGLAPAWRLARTELLGLLNESGHGSRAGLGPNRVFGPLVVVEVALAVILVIGAGLLVRTYSNLTTSELGFDPDRALTFFMNVPGRISIDYDVTPGGDVTYTGSLYQPVAQFYSELEERIEALPGVEAVTDAKSVPLAPVQYDRNQIINLPDQPGGTEAIAEAITRAVGDDFFEVMGIRVVQGRGLEPTDREGTPGVALVNETFARRFFPGQNPLGQRIHYADNRFKPLNTGFQFGHYTVDDVEVVGVVGDVKYTGLAEPIVPTVFISTEQWIDRRRHLVVRAATDDVGALVPAITREIEAMDPSLTARFELYSTIVRASTARERLGTTLLVVFGLVALALASVGIYGLMSYYVAQRRGEIAVRSAMGASAGSVMGLVMRRGVSYAVAGIVLGVAGAAALRRVLESQLFGISALDVPVFVLVPLILLGVATLACFLPSRRATKIHPADLLRAE